MAQADVAASEPPPLRLPSTQFGTPGFFRKLFGRQNGGSTPPSPTDQPLDTEQGSDSADPEKGGLIRRMSRRVVPNLPRAQTFKRQQSERRTNLAPVEPTSDERRAVSVDRRSQAPRDLSTSQPHADPRISAPSLLACPQDEAPRYVPPLPLLPMNPVEDVPVEVQLDKIVSKDDEITLADDCATQDNLSTADTHSLTTSQYDAIIHDELEKTWILNLSMHFRDRSRREKFFVTYREQEHTWRRVTISLDYRNAPLNSLEMDLIHTQYQREKSAKIYEAIRESLRDIQFYDTVTNLKLQTTDGRLHVHVVEDGNEIIPYPTVAQVKHLGCKRIRERDILFDSHMSGFVYKVNVHGQTLIKKEIPSPDTVDEFLYEVNALNRLRYSENVIRFHGVVVDDDDEYVKGLLISYADQGALIDIIYDNCKDGEFDIPWPTRKKWARQIVEGLSDIHDSGFVQGDFTLSNIVIDENGDAKIIDINRRGCPVGWEPPEATPLIECNQRISMYIGVKSDLYQLGMVLWALAMQEDEPEAQGRPLILGPEVNIPDWYRQMAEICLSDDPRLRLQASSLLQMFPSQSTRDDCGKLNPPSMSVDEDYTLQQYLVDDYHPESHPHIRTVEPPSEWSYVGRPYADASPIGYEPYYYTRGRSPPSPLPSNYDRCDSPRRPYDISAWAANRNIPSSYSDVGPDDMSLDETPIANKTDLIEPNSLVASNTAIGGKAQDTLPVSETKSRSKGPIESPEESGVNDGKIVSTVDNIDQAERNALEESERVRASEMLVLDPGRRKTVEVVGEEQAPMTTRTAPMPVDTGREHSSTKADSACDVVMPLDQVDKEEAEEKDFGWVSMAKPAEGAEKFANDNSSSDTPEKAEHVAQQQASETLFDAEIGMSALQALKVKPGSEHNAPELHGTTAPQPQTTNTVSSSRTVTPSKPRENAGNKGIHQKLEESGQPERDGGISDDRTCVKVDGNKLNDPDPLTGIGAAYLTNHDGDAIRHKQTIDEDLDVVETMFLNAMTNT